MIAPRSGASPLAVSALVVAALWAFGIGSILGICLALADHQERRQAGAGRSAVDVAAFAVGVAGLAVTVIVVFVLGGTGSAPS